MDTGLEHRYLHSRQHIDDGIASTLFEIGDHKSDIICGDDDVPEIHETLSMGMQSLADKHFSQTPPSAADLERAIYEIEDEVMRIRQSIPANSVLITLDVDMLRVAEAAGHDGGDASALSLDAVEQLYQRVAAMAEGRPVTQDSVPVDLEFIARVLILREFMHHMGFAEITLLAA